MKIIIEIDTDNAAFVDDGVEYELSRILIELADKLLFNNIHSFDKIRDINGNTVGSFTVVDGDGS